MHDFQFFERARLEALLELEYQHEVARAQVSCSPPFNFLSLPFSSTLSGLVT